MKWGYLIALILVLFIVSSCAQLPTPAPTPPPAPSPPAPTPTPTEEVPPFDEVTPEVPAVEKVEIQKKGGRLYHNETWSGNILVVDTVVVPAGITLTIEPGTTVNRDFPYQL